MMTAARTSGLRERTGDARLDELIEAYLDRDEYDLYADIGGNPNETPARLSALRSAEVASGRCAVVACDFEQFLVARGLQAHAECREEPQTWGYDDRDADPGHDEHWVVTVPRDDGGWYVIDFTAAQFGYGAFPFVQLLDDARLHRAW